MSWTTFPNTPTPMTTTVPPSSTGRSRSATARNNRSPKPSMPNRASITNVERTSSPSASVKSIEKNGIAAFRRTWAATRYPDAPLALTSETNSAVAYSRE
nr:MULTISPECIES: hypothetical protein [unclassified Halorubrum]